MYEPIKFKSMKYYRFLIFVCILMIANMVAAQQKDNVNNNDSTGLPGDDFSLQGALEMFKNAKSLEDFEQKLNTENNYVNNLDLDGDGNIDYIKVNDKTDGKVHAIVLQVPVNKTELQDIAVIEIEKNGNESAMLQIVGDEELYGDSTIVEPYDVSEVKTMDNGPICGASELKVIFVNVWMWPCVSYMYSPGYVVWVSPWYYNYYPVWYQPWEPYPWYVHHNHCSHYYYGYHPVYTHRVIVAHNYYMPHRNTSMVVVNKYKPAHLKYKANQPYKTYKKPTPNNNKNIKNNNAPKSNNNKNVNKNNSSKQNNNKNVKQNNSSKQNNNKNIKNNNAPKSNKNNNVKQNNSSKQNNAPKSNKGGGSNKKGNK